ncbi:hypothetical protein [Rhodanobacter glycinis]|uniref:hypothetical protein n=1 Tax=Rhodanobacter glycinis TaxID=582702 RepID=UPI00112BE58A|nr:hypothetical protein [Rhodanobacter glycinis]
MKSNHFARPDRTATPVRQGLPGKCGIMNWTSIRPNNISLKICQCLETVAAQRFRDNGLDTDSMASHATSVSLRAMIGVAATLPPDERNTTEMIFIDGPEYPENSGHRSSRTVRRSASRIAKSLPLIVEVCAHEQVFLTDCIDDAYECGHHFNTT